jgi:hypothetical protein
MGKKSSTTPLENPEIGWDNPAPEKAGSTGLDKVYFFREPTQILNFLKLNPYITPLLAETADALKGYFPDVKFAIRRYVDPEISGFTRLVIEIPTKYSPQETLSRLDKFEDEWWIENEYKSKGNLTVNVEFL